MLLFFAEENTERLFYITDLLLRQLACVQTEITTDKEVFKSYAGPKINYSAERICVDEFNIKPHSLLFEEDIQQHAIECFNKNGLKFFFKNEGDDLGFDVLAASFYVVTRYEEYLPYEEDEYGRYPYTNSLAYKEDFLHLPLVNIWATDLKNALKQKFSSFKISDNDFRFIPTYDIDIAFSFRSKGFIRSIGGWVKNFFNGEWTLLKKRIEVKRGKKQDPYDCYEWLDGLHENLKLLPVYFFLVADRQTGFDKNISPANEELGKLIKRHAEKYFVGVHPSWKSNESENILKKEIETMGQLSGSRKIVISRQHYIKMKLPETYQRLINAGIELDFSMGYGSVNGFRASIASPFKWFDITKNELTGLTVYPFCFMDANSFYELKQTPEQAYNELRQLYSTVKKINGTFVTVWHNHFLGTDPQFIGWKEMYELFLREDLYWDFLEPA
ncbi:MAG TPA: polysaccharide deacetylase family protein [Chitinophagaceae bacterium]|nr:polysaccharide deacetylase family protein [Chitinophagaceae bacterium]